MIKTLFTRTDEAKPDLKPFSPRSMRVLIVEDDPLDKTLIARAMEKFGAKRITTTETGEEALKRLNRESFDVVLADQGLPRMSGLELVETIHDRWPLIHVILVTGAGNEHIAAAAIKAGAWEYVAKDDFLTSGLIRAVHSAVRTDQDLDRQAIGATTEATMLLAPIAAEAALAARLRVDVALRHLRAQPRRPRSRPQPRRHGAIPGRISCRASPWSRAGRRTRSS